MKRLFGCSVSLIYGDKHGSPVCVLTISPRVGSFGGTPSTPTERVLWDSKIRLSEPFFNEIINHPVPIDMTTLKALKRCSLGLDLYLWVAYPPVSG